MATLAQKRQNSSFRLADFCNANLPLRHVLPLDTSDVQRVVTEIRQYSDMPFVFLLSADQAPFIIDLLARLRSIRATGYPYALFLNGCTNADSVAALDAAALSVDVFTISEADPIAMSEKITAYAESRFSFDHRRLQMQNPNPLPRMVDVLIVGAGVTGLFAAHTLKEHNISCCVIDKRDLVGGIWSLYANSTSQVNSSECAYRLIEKNVRSNRDHSTTREILEDIQGLAAAVSDRLFLNTAAERIRKTPQGYETDLIRDRQTGPLSSKGIILAINDRVGAPRKVHWEDQDLFKGRILNGFSDDTRDFDWTAKKVAIVGMGAFAVENARTALEGGADQVTVICRRHGTVCPKIIDYLNFATPYDDQFKHANKSNMRNMLLWKNLYKRSGATEPECWMGKIKHPGHTISVSDIWFVAHFLKKLQTVRGAVSGMFDHGVIVDRQMRIAADVVINCVGFHRNAPAVQALSGYTQTTNINYLDKDFMYLADAYIDDGAFNSFFGSSVLEMAKFYLNVFVRFFDKPGFEVMLQSPGVQRVPIEERSWSHYIAGATALMNTYADIHKMAHRQVARRTRNFMEAHDLQTYIAQNKREWIDMHAQLAGRPIKEEECLPYVFEKLLEDKL